jgi:hypothetical protein
MDNYCCWNMKNAHRLNRFDPAHNDDCLATHGPVYADATMAVTFMDDKTIIYKNVRVCVNRPDNDGIRVDGTTLAFEAGDVCLTVLGVRQFAYEID